MSNDIRELELRCRHAVYIDTVEVADSSSAEPTTESITSGSEQGPEVPQKDKIGPVDGTNWDHADTARLDYLIRRGARVQHDIRGYGWVCMGPGCAGVQRTLSVRQCATARAAIDSAITRGAL